MPAVPSGLLRVGVLSHGCDVLGPLRHGLLRQLGRPHGRDVLGALRVRDVRRSDGIDRIYVHLHVQRGRVRTRLVSAHRGHVRWAVRDGLLVPRGLVRADTERLSSGDVWSHDGPLTRVLHGAVQRGVFRQQRRADDPRVQWVVRVRQVWGHDRPYHLHVHGAVQRGRVRACCDGAHRRHVRWAVYARVLVPRGLVHRDSKRVPRRHVRRNCRPLRVDVHRPL